MTRVALVALTTSGAAGDYVAALSSAMSERVTTSAWIPDRPSLTLAAEAHVLEKPRSRAGVASREAVALLRHSTLADEVGRWNPDVVHIVFGEGYPSALKAARSLAAKGTPVAATWHDPKPHGQVFDRVQHAVAAQTMRTASGVHVHCESLVPDDVRARALERIDGLPDGDRLLHGDFHPANLLRTTDGCVVIDWTNGMSGDPASDVARTILLMGGGRLADGTPVVVRVIAPVARRLLISGYLRAYRRDAPLDRGLVDRWLPVWAAARLAEDIEQEREFLLERAR